LLVQFSFSDDGVERELCGWKHGYKCDQCVECNID